VAETATQSSGSAEGFAFSHRPPTSPQYSADTPAGTMAEYVGQTPMDLCAGRRRIKADEWAKSVTKGRCLDCGGYNHSAAEFTSWKKALTWILPGVGCYGGVFH